MYESTPNELPGRNAPCWCGSSRKYKKCHLSADRAGRPATRVVPPSLVRLKTPAEIEGIRAAGALTHDILDMLEERVALGTTTEQIDVWVQEALSTAGATAATLGYKGYPKSCCTSINEVVCHGIPEARELVGGDIVNIDVTSILDGFYGDASRMYLVGDVSEQAKKLVDVTRECLDRAIETVLHGAFLGDIGHAIQQHAESNGFSVVRAFVGHGTGVDFHEEPQVPHYGRRGHGQPLQEGSVFTIEPMINAGHWDVKILEDGWTAVTVDSSLSAQWEHTILVTSDGVERLTA